MFCLEKSNGGASAISELQKMILNLYDSSNVWMKDKKGLVSHMKYSLS